MGDYDEKGKCVLWWSGHSRCVFAGSFRLFIIILCGGLGLGSFVCKGVEEDGKLSSVRFWTHVTEVYAPGNLLSHLRVVDHKDMHAAIFAQGHLLVL